MLYSVGEMAKPLGISTSARRYCDQKGLLPFVERSGGGMRMFKDSDHEWLQFITCLKKTGVPLKDIQSAVTKKGLSQNKISEKIACKKSLGIT